MLRVQMKSCLHKAPILSILKFHVAIQCKCNTLEAFGEQCTLRSWFYQTVDPYTVDHSFLSDLDTGETGTGETGSD